VNKQFLSVLLALLRSPLGGWLFVSAFVQLLVASSVWALQADHLPLIGVLIMAIAGRRSLSTERFAWRVLPIARSTLAFARWSIMCPATGIAMTAALILGLLNNHGLGFPAPPLAPQILALWSAVGYLACLPGKADSRSASVPRFLGAALVVLLVLLGAYGYPLLRPGWQALSYALMGLGFVLLAAAPLRILLGSGAPSASEQDSSRARAGDLQPSAAAERVAPQSDAAQLSDNEPRGGSSGWGVLIRPLLVHTGAMSLVCIGAASALRITYPRAAEPLSWAFLCVVAVWSVFLTRRWTRSLWVWRCLPISSARLAAYLRFFASLPAAVTLLLAVTVNRLAPEASLPLPGWVIVAFMGLQAIVDAQPRGDTKKDRAGPQSWLLVETVRMTYPGYVAAAIIALFALFISMQCAICSQSLVFRGLTIWLPNVVALVAGLLLVGAYAITRGQLHSGSDHDL
jgi:hypothetical protein